MHYWFVTVALAAIAYCLGFRQGWRSYESQMNRALNRVAYKLGVPPDHPFWSDEDETN